MTAPIDRLLDIMATLRSENGCPWDREQDLTTLKPYLIEEAYEVLDAIDRGDVNQHKEELGDLLLQVVFQTQITMEDDQFAFDDVVNAISDKLVRRHPHVFGDLAVSGSDEVLSNWDAIKREEKAEAGKSESVLDSVPRALPALMRAHELQKRAARIGFDWPDAADVLPCLDEELAEVKEAIASGDAPAVAEELGDLLFAVVNFARKKGLRSEELLQAANAKFSRRFHEVEAKASARGLDMNGMNLEELDALWDEVKAESPR